MKAKVLVLGVLLVVALVACQRLLLTSTQPEAPGATGETGRVAVSVPSISSRLAQALGVVSAGAQASSKALLIISRVEFELWLAGEVVDTMEATPNEGPSGGQYVDYWYVTAAAGYTLTARVYNTWVDEDIPVLYGESEPFDVTSGGSVYVPIRPLPAPPTTLAPVSVPPSPSVVNTTLQSCYTEGTETEWYDGFPVEVPVYRWREERWFAIDASSYSAIRINADPDTSSAAVIFVADSEGRTLGMAGSGLFDEGPVYWVWGGVASMALLTPGEEYYVGLITLSSTDGVPVTSSVDVNFEEFADDEYEENDSIDEAAPISMGVAIDGIDLDPLEWEEGDPPGDGGDWYQFTLGESDDPNVTILLEFDYDKGPVDFVLWSWDGLGDPMMLAKSPGEAEPSGPDNPDALEQEVLAVTLDPGDYYIWVGGGAVGSGYSLKWTAGEGEIEIGLE